MLANWVLSSVETYSRISYSTTQLLRNGDNIHDPVVLDVGIALANYVLQTIIIGTNCLLLIRFKYGPEVSITISFNWSVAWNRCTGRLCFSCGIFGTYSLTSVSLVDVICNILPYKICVASCRTYVFHIHVPPMLDSASDKKCVVVETYNPLSVQSSRWVLCGPKFHSCSIWTSSLVVSL